MNKNFMLGNLSNTLNMIIKFKDTGVGNAGSVCTIEYGLNYGGRRCMTKNYSFEIYYNVFGDTEQPSTSG